MINTPHNIDDFFSGHLIVNKDRKITFCNSYICYLTNQSEDELLNTSISEYITKASNIFIDSYVYPLLITELIVKEIQITWKTQQNEKVPVVVNIKLGKNGISYWSIYVCATRDKLQNELLLANDKLEKQSLELFRLATTDSLTGLLNRRELQVQAQNVIYQATRNQSTFAILSLDIDFFKNVNDTHGHQVGDKVLVHLANLLTENRRANDIEARVGGEEFILILPDINEQNAYRLSESLRKRIESESINNIFITVSIGLVVTRKNADVNFDELLQLSDNALYDSKDNGRNMTSIAQLKQTV